jgi:DNA-binding HxlR family transcriptional regulator
MTRLRSYGQYCGLAHALELIGERWALLIVRDLIVGPKRFTDLRLGLPRIPTNVLSTRLKELEETGVVQRRALPRPAASVVYELTGYGSQLEEIVLKLGAWGAQTMGDPKPEDVFTADGAILALRTAVRATPAVGERIGYQLQIADVVVHARLEDGSVTVGPGPLPGADVVLSMPEVITFKTLLIGQLNPADALLDGAVTVEGRLELFERFTDFFGMGAPAAEPV